MVDRILRLCRTVRTLTGSRVRTACGFGRSTSCSIGTIPRATDSLSGRGYGLWVDPSYRIRAGRAALRRARAEGTTPVYRTANTARVVPAGQRQARLSYVCAYR